MKGLFVIWRPQKGPRSLLETLPSPVHPGEGLSWGGSTMVLVRGEQGRDMAARPCTSGSDVERRSEEPSSHTPCTARPSSGASGLFASSPAPRSGRVGRAGAGWGPGQAARPRSPAQLSWGSGYSAPGRSWGRSREKGCVPPWCSEGRGESPRAVWGGCTWALGFSESSPAVSGGNWVSYGVSSTGTGSKERVRGC